MTKSPLAVTLLPLIPLAALGWPLAKVINQKIELPPEVEEVGTGPIVTADLKIKSAHPFLKLTVTRDQTSWSFAPDDDIKEIHYERSESLDLTVSAVWPEGTPETAVLIEVQPEGVVSQSQTIWGLGEVPAPVKFVWDEEP